MTHHIILGAGPAAIQAIETIRGCDGGASQVSLISDEPAYARMLLPKWLANQVAKQQVLTADDAAFARLKVDRYIGQPAVRVNPQARTVTIRGGQVLPFDDLLIATGSSPVVPPIPGADLPGVFTFWTMAHAQAVLNAIAGKDQPDVLVIGAGFIGCILLSALHERGCKLQVVEKAQHILPGMLPAEPAKLLEAWLQKKGFGLHTRSTVQEISLATPAAPAESALPDRKHVTLSNGTCLEVDLVILATDRRPNLEPARRTGIHLDQAILVNERMQTNFPHIYAAGDVAQGPDLLGGPPAVHAIHATAVEHGRVAGANMAGEDVKYAGSLLTRSFECCGLLCASFGRWDEQTEVMTALDPERPAFRRLLWTGDQLAGAVLVGPAGDGLRDDIDMVGKIMRAKTALGAWKNDLKENLFDIRRTRAAL